MSEEHSLFTCDCGASFITDKELHEHHKRIDRIVPTENFHPKNKRGHPKKYEQEKPSGPKIYYKPSQFEISINLLLSKEKVVELIYRSLFKKRLLFELEKWINLYIYHVIRNYDKETAWKIYKSVFSIPYTGTKFDEEYHKIRGIEVKELEKLAELKANLQIKKKSRSDYLYIFKIGAYYFKALTSLKC